VRALRQTRGLTLLELMVVIAIMGLASAGVSLAMRDTAGEQLSREAERLAALLEAGRAASRASGVPVRWQPTDQGFRFEGLQAQSLPERWLSPGVSPVSSQAITLGPEPVIGPQRVQLSNQATPPRTVTLVSDGLRPFAIEAGAAP
jgi:general secretion pathway protein H